MKKTVKSATFRLQYDLLQTIKQVAAEEGITQSAVVSRAIQFMADSNTDAINPQQDYSNLKYDLLQQEINIKNKHIDELQRQNGELIASQRESNNIISQNNHIIGALTQQVSLIEQKQKQESNIDPEPEEINNTPVSKKSKKKQKRQQSKRKNRKKGKKKKK